MHDFNICIIIYKYLQYTNFLNSFLNLHYKYTLSIGIDF